MTPSLKDPSPAVQALQKSTIPALRRLQVEETESEVVLSGNVPSFYLKQMAQETVRFALEQRSLSNRVEVTRA